MLHNDYSVMGMQLDSVWGHLSEADNRNARPSKFVEMERPAHAMIIPKLGQCAYDSLRGKYKISIGPFPNTIFPHTSLTLDMKGVSEFDLDSNDGDSVS